MAMITVEKEEAKMMEKKIYRIRGGK